MVETKVAHSKFRPVHIFISTFLLSLKFVFRHFEEATLLYEDILAANPLDSLAMKAAYFGNFFQGKKAQLRDTVARAMPAWKPHMPLYRYVWLSLG